MNKIVFLIAGMLIFSACGKKTKQTVTLDITFNSEGPFFESSPESLQHQLIDELKDCKDGTACPHGRRAILSLNREELARRFQRPGAPPL